MILRCGSVITLRFRGGGRRGLNDDVDDDEEEARDAARVGTVFVRVMWWWGWNDEYGL